MNKFEIEGMELPETTAETHSEVSSPMPFTFPSPCSPLPGTVNTYPVGFYRHLAMAEGILGWFLPRLFVVVMSGVLIR